MTKLSNYLLVFSSFFAFQLLPSASAMTIDDVKEYCHSMTSAGMSTEDMQSLVAFRAARR